MHWLMPHDGQVTQDDRGGERFEDQAARIGIFWRPDYFGETPGGVQIGKLNTDPALS